MKARRRFIILLIVVGLIGFSAATAWVASAGDTGSDPTGVPNPPPYTGPPSTNTILGWQEPGPDVAQR